MQLFVPLNQTFVIHFNEEIQKVVSPPSCKFEIVERDLVGICSEGASVFVKTKESSYIIKLVVKEEGGKYEFFAKVKKVRRKIKRYEGMPLERKIAEFLKDYSSLPYTSINQSISTPDFMFNFIRRYELDDLIVLYGKVKNRYFKVKKLYENSKLFKEILWQEDVQLAAKDL